MSHQLVSGSTLTSLYKYLQENGGSYNDLKVRFQNSGIREDPNVVSASTRNKDKFLDRYVRPLNLSDTGQVQSLITFIEQTVDFGQPQSLELLRCLQQDGWQIVSRKIVLCGNSVDDLITSMLRSHPIDTIQREWDRAKSSVVSDPADAITAASSMVEATYKFILHELNKPLPPGQDIRELSKLVYPLLEIAPDQHADQDFRALFQGTITITQSVGSLRTKLGDAHGASPIRETQILSTPV